MNCSDIKIYTYILMLYSNKSLLKGGSTIDAKTQAWWDAAIQELAYVEQQYVRYS